jgi:hypothetical protein
MRNKQAANHRKSEPEIMPSERINVYPECIKFLSSLLNRRFVEKAFVIEMIML